MSLRLRFAPSPTGFLHVGGARTAIFNWLLARKEGGVLVLRIEDTDRERSSEEHTRAILDGLSWLGVDWDEGPVFQSDGLERHKADALSLLESGQAYRDFSTPDEAAADREEEQRTGGRTRRARERADGRTDAAEEALLAEGRPFAVRFRVPRGETVWEDRVHGETRFQNSEIDDLVILRSDGTPTYNLAVVSDDSDMGINLVLRGDDHLSNTPKQILLYEALGRPVPAFAHVPLILGTDGKRLSKRHGATAVGEYAREGILPQAMFNFLTFLGWSPGDDREVFTPGELVEAFSLDRVLKKGSVFDPDKLAWMNGQHLQKIPDQDVLEEMKGRLHEMGLPGAGAEAPVDLAFLVELLKPRSRTLEDLASQAVPYLAEKVEYEEKAVKKHWAKDPSAAVQRLERLRDILAGIPWEHDALESGIRGLAEELGVGAGKVIHPLRLAITGLGGSPGIFDVLLLLGRERTLQRIDRALDHLGGGTIGSS